MGQLYLYLEVLNRKEKTMESQRIEAVIAHIQELTPLYYQNCPEKGTEQLQALIQELSGLEALIPREQQSRYIGILKNLMEAIEQRDFVMLADILTFDMLEFLQEDEG